MIYQIQLSIIYSMDREKQVQKGNIASRTPASRNPHGEIAQTDFAMSVHLCKHYLQIPHY